MEMRKKPRAIIITGNPKYIQGDQRAKVFYQKIKTHLEQKGYGVAFDPGAPRTSPPKADLWVGHSRGVDRLRFAPEGTKTVAFGVSGGLSHPRDSSLKLNGKPPAGFRPNKHHYRLTKQMAAALPGKDDLVESKQAGAAPLQTTKELKKKLRPGDIVVTSMVKARPELSRAGVEEAVFRGFSKKMQGDWTHAGVYVGKDRIIEMRDSLQERKLPRAFPGIDAKILRPRLPARDRHAAAKKLIDLAKSHKRQADYASVPQMLKIVAEDMGKRRLFKGEGDEELEKQRFTCSNLIAHVYKDKVDFTAGNKGVGYVIPRDLVDSPHTRTIATYRNRKRHDKDQRMKTSMINTRSLDGFGDTVGHEKVAIIGALGRAAGAVGGKMLGLAGRGAKAISRPGGRLAGAGQRFGKARGAMGRAVGGQANLEKVVGGGAMLAGGSLAVGGLAGRATAPRR